jgi:hypothetical protein
MPILILAHGVGMGAGQGAVTLTNQRTVHAAIPLTVAAGEVLRFRVERTSGAADVYTAPDGCRFHIVRRDGRD